MSSLAEELASYARAKHLSPQTLQRWQSWTTEDQGALLLVTKELQLNENQLRDFLDWLEEIVARDGGAIRDVLMRSEGQQPLDVQLSRNDKLKVIKAHIRKIRYPRLSQLEDDLRATIKALDLGNRLRISLPPALEGNDITFEIKACSVQELSSSLVKMQQKLADGSLQRVFELMDEV